MNPVAVEKLLATTVMAGGTAVGAAATSLPLGDAPVIALSLASIISICTGAFWYGRLTERVKSLQEAQARTESVVSRLQEEQVDGRVVDRMVSSMERLSTSVTRITAHLKIETHDDAGTYTNR